MTREEKLIAKRLDHERRKQLWRDKIIDEEIIICSSEFRKSIKKISAEIDLIFYGYKKINRNNYLD